MPQMSPLMWVVLLFFFVFFFFFSFVILYYKISLFGLDLSFKLPVSKFLLLF